MNEIDLTTKIEGLKKAIAEHEEMSQAHKDSLSKVEKQLEDYNKPELTPKQLDKIYETIEKVVTDFDFSDTDNYEIDYTLDYDGRVQCESHEFINGSDLVQELVDKVQDLFKEADAPEEETTDNSQLNTR